MISPDEDVDGLFDSIQNFSDVRIHRSCQFLLYVLAPRTDQ